MSIPMSKPRFTCLLLPLLLGSVASALERVEILVDPADQAYLEANPYDADKVPAKWIAGGETLSVSVSYRGAYSLRSLLAVKGGPRNWKVKTAKGSTYRGFREWNFNKEAHLRQKMSLDLFVAAGVAAMPARHVSLWVNGKRSGTYLEFPDPDNKNWLARTWGDGGAGNLYKAATDIPGWPARFGETTDLGDADSGYYGHYQKKTNNDGPDSADYSSLREFLGWVNRSEAAQFKSGLPSRFDVQSFVRYLVVANFVGHWDGFPNRGKNYWLYQDSLRTAWHVIPWDVDGSFQTSKYCLNNMGVSAGLFFMEWPASYCPNKLETRKRPLFERFMAVEEFKRAYIGEYQNALSTYLAESVLVRRADSLGVLMKEGVVDSEKVSFSKDQAELLDYIHKRSVQVAALLSKYPDYAAFRSVAVADRSRGPRAVPVPDWWVDAKGARVPDSRLRQAPPGVYRRGAELKVVF